MFFDYSLISNFDRQHCSFEELFALENKEKAERIGEFTRGALLCSPVSVFSSKL